MRLVVLFLAVLSSCTIQAQNNIPIGAWRSHFSYNRALEVVEAKDRIYAVAENGLFYFDTADNSLGTINKLDGLQGDEISTIAYVDQRDQLLIGYTSGNLDVIADNEIISFDFISASQVLGSKKINHILVDGARAFISTDYGLLNFDLISLSLSESYRELGEEAEQIIVNQSAVLGDSLFLGTESGVIASNIKNGTNLFNPDNWRRYDQVDGIEKINIPFIISFDDLLIAAIDGTGLLGYQNTDWSLLSVLPDRSFNNIRFNNEVLSVVSDNEVFLIDRSLTSTSVQLPNDSQVNDVISIESIIWLADENQGLLSNISGSFESIKPSGPFSNQVLRFFHNNSIVFSLPGGFDEFRKPLNDSSGYYTFQDGFWNNFNNQNNNFTDFKDVTDVASFDNGSRLFFSSFNDGLLEVIDDEIVTLFQSSNSTLQEDEDENYKITAVEASAEGLWLINYGAARPLHLYTDRWESFSLPTSAIVDFVNTPQYLWLVIDSQAGGGLLVYDKEQDESRFLNDQDGNGSLPSDNVNSIAVDNDGLIWVGTNAGVAYFSSVSNITQGSINAIIPIFENRLLLRNEVITSIEVDPGNRKWIGTERGLWLFDENTDNQIQFFDINNSPIPSNEIIDIEVLEQTGEVFIATTSGTVSYRSDATTPDAAHSNVKIFPNPITADFNGTVGISGLVANASVKITDASGKMIWETRSAGGSATWNVSDYNGRRAATGIYFVFSSSTDGEETFVGKIAVIN